MTAATDSPPHETSRLGAPPMRVQPEEPAVTRWVVGPTAQLAQVLLDRARDGRRGHGATGAAGTDGGTRTGSTRTGSTRTGSTRTGSTGSADSAGSTGSADSAGSTGSTGSAGSSPSGHGPSGTDVPVTPLVVAVDGRGGAGKSTLARALRAAVPGTVVLGTDDLAWNEPLFDWGHLLVEALTRVRTDGALSMVPPAWTAHGREGAVTVPPGTPLVVVEGTGASQRAVSALVDAVAWVQSDDAVAEARGLARDVADGVNGDVEEATEFWHWWMRAERAFFATDRPWERADVVVAGTPTVPLEPGTSAWTSAADVPVRPAAPALPAPVPSFPRAPDGLPGTWRPPQRFTPAYEERLEALWDAAVRLGHVPELAPAGREDSEALLVHDGSGPDVLCLIAVEDPTVQDAVDAARARGDEGLAAWLRERVAEG